jgi:hypothetical protein
MSRTDVIKETEMIPGSERTVRFSIEKERLLKIARYCELIAGSEKKYGFLWLFFDKGLRFFVTDGALKTVFQAKGDFPVFYRTYQFPIHPLKLFLQEKSVEPMITIVLAENEAVFLCDNEVLSLKQPAEEVIERIDSTDTLCALPFRSFLKGIDFATVSVPTMERIMFVDYDGFLIVVSMDHDSFTVFNSKTVINRLEDGTMMEVQIPYASTRHFVKACSLIDVEELKISNSHEKELLYFQTPGAITSVCMKKLESEDSRDLFFLLHIYEQMEPIARLNTQKTQKLLNRALRLSENGVLNLSLSSEEIAFWISKKAMFYSVKDKVETYFGEACRSTSLQFYGKKIKSSLNRIKTKYVFLYQSGEFFGFGDEKKEMVVVAKGKNIERSWKDAGMG